MKTLLLAGFFALASSQTVPQGNGIVEGTVTRYGSFDGIANVEITLTVEGASGGITVSPDAMTDANGRFVILDVSPGRYVLRAQRGGYVNPAPDGVRLRDGGTTKWVAVGPQQHVDDANLSMVTGGVIAGRILDPDGTPLVRAGISLSPLSPEETGAAKSGETNDRGEYRIFGLEPGKYRVAGSAPQPLSAYPFRPRDRTYFPGVTDMTRATTLNIVEGEILTGIDIKIQSAEKTFRISGKVVIPNVDPGDVRMFELYLVPKESATRKGRQEDEREGMFAFEIPHRVAGDSAGRPEFSFEGVRSGAYDLFLALGGRRDLGDCCDVVGQVALDVSAQDVQGVTIVAGGVDVRGQVVLNGNPASPPAVSFSLARFHRISARGRLNLTRRARSRFPL